MHKQRIDVVAAVIKKNNLFLVANRSFEAKSAGIWEFPGGKVEEKETFVSALIREIEEELSLKIQVGDKITSIDLRASDKHTSVHYFNALILSGEITLHVIIIQYAHQYGPVALFKKAYCSNSTPEYHAINNSVK